MIVTLSRSAWRDLRAMALGHAREGGGLLIGRWTRRGNMRVRHVTGMTHVRASDSDVEYTKDEKAKAKRAAFELFAPLEAVGEWHSHPRNACNALALEAQITEADAREMLDGAVEVIVVTYPDPGYRLPGDKYILQYHGNGSVCRAEAWVRRGDEAKPCEIRVR